MLFRSYQKRAIAKCIEALKERGNTMLVAPTGSGKTLMLSGVVGDIVGKEGRGLVLQHRGELLSQNRDKFRKVTGAGITTGAINADTKQFDRQVMFAMTETLRNDKNLAKLPPLDIITVDEGHRGVTPSNLKIFEAARASNPKVKLFLVTATPDRGDSKSLREVVDNIADQITIGELIRSGHLVKPRTFVVNLGVQSELQSVKKTASDFDMKAVEQIMDKTPLLDKIVEEWKRLASDRITIAFASTVAHATHVAEAFVAAGVRAEVVSGETPSGEREAILKRLERGETRIVVNVAALIEGLDIQPISCVMLLRPSSHKSTYIQMVGRGLRTVDPELYPGVVKNDCLILDFGTSTLIHGTLEQEASLGRVKSSDGEAPKKVCPSCDAHVPLNAFECGLCGHEFMIADPEAEGGFREKGTLENFLLTEVEIFQDSPYRWEELWDGVVIVASAFDAFSVCVLFKGEWHAIGGSKEKGLTHLARGEKVLAIAKADDFLREHGDSDSAKKSKRWLKEPATLKQLQYLRVDPKEAFAITRYKAACLLSWAFNERGIKVKLNQAASSKESALKAAA